MEGLDELPTEEQCYGCALATLYINQAVEAKLKEKAESLLRASQAGAQLAAHPPLSQRERAG
jgi:hypothetical protein